MAAGAFPPGPLQDEHAEPTPWTHCSYPGSSEKACVYLKSLTIYSRYFLETFQNAQMLRCWAGDQEIPLWGKYRRDLAGELWVSGSCPACSTCLGRLAGLGRAGGKRGSILPLFLPLPLPPGHHQQNCPCWAKKLDSQILFLGRDPHKSQQITTSPSAGLWLRLQSKDQCFILPPKPGNFLVALPSCLGMGGNWPSPTAHVSPS